MILRIKILKGACVYVAGQEWYIPDSEAEQAFKDISRFISERVAQVKIKKVRDE